MQRASSIEALLKRATADATALRGAYEASLHAKEGLHNLGAPGPM